MNIAITRKNQTATEVNLEISTDIPCERSRLVFSFDCVYQYVAGLLQEHLQKSLGNHLCQIRRRAYEQGYCDGRNHRQKETWFSKFF